MRNDTAEAAIDMPSPWRADLQGYRWTRQTNGCSEAAVFRLDADGRRSLFLKIEPTQPLGELRDEAERLRWLRGWGIACPDVLAETREDGRDWLLISALPGRDLASSPELAAAQIVEIAAAALRGLHRIDPADCPFDHRLDRRIAHARARIDAGLVDEDDFDDERRGFGAEALYAELVARRPSAQDLVVTHGDACLANLIADQGRFSGFIDCARLGVADRHQDLALATREIGEALGDKWVERFFELYGGTVDPDRLAYYRLLDEFF